VTKDSHIEVDVKDNQIVFRNKREV